MVHFLFLDAAMSVGTDKLKNLIQSISKPLDILHRTLRCKVSNKGAELDRQGELNLTFKGHKIAGAACCLMQCCNGRQIRSQIVTNRLESIVYQGVGL